MKILRPFLKSVFHRFGFDLIRLKANPEVTFLGIRRFPIKTIIDVGANTGQFAKKMREMFPEAAIHCFEPLPDAHKRLYRWARGEEGKVFAYRVALGDIEGEQTMLRHLDHDTSSSMLDTTRKIEDLYEFTRRQAPLLVPVRALDGLLDEHGKSIHSELLIKLDVQGYEDRVIRGGSETFRKASACVLEINLEGFYEKQADFRCLTNQLHELGFRYAGNLDQVYGEDGRVLFIDAVFIRKPLD